MASHVTAPETRWLGSTPLFRVARADAPLRPSVIDSADAATNAGNRFDVVGGGVLYLASTPAGCYTETLARFRPTAAMRAALNADEEWATSFVVYGGVPADWRTRRLKVQVAAPGSLPFLDVEHPRSPASSSPRNWPGSWPPSASPSSTSATPAVAPGH